MKTLKILVLILCMPMITHPIPVTTGQAIDTETKIALGGGGALIGLGISAVCCATHDIYKTVARNPGIPHQVAETQLVRIRVKDNLALISMGTLAICIGFLSVSYMSAQSCHSS